jgi:uncharacterized integral membrane protein
MQIGLIIGLVFGLVIAFFAVLNTELVTLNYYFGQFNISVALLVLSAAVMGALAVGLLGLVKQVRTGFALWDYRNKLKRLQKEVEGLKEQKKALSDDLSFVNAECELTLRQKETEMEEFKEEVEEADMQEVDDYEAADEAEEKKNDDI